VVVEGKFSDLVSCRGTYIAYIQKKGNYI